MTTFQPLFSSSFLQAEWRADYRRYCQEMDEAVMLRLRQWDGRHRGTETSDEGSFINIFFRELWGYKGAGEGDPIEGHTFTQQYRVAGAGAAGGQGRADLALGYFGTGKADNVPQVLCEFKDIRSGLDDPQRRKGDARSPVKQCADYIREALKPLYGNEPVLPTWGIVTDMNEFRLYWWNRMPTQYQRFVLRARDGADDVSLIDDTDAARLQRFLFWRMFRPDYLLSRGGRPALAHLIQAQNQQERQIEEDFYGEYADYRLRIFNVMATHNADKGHSEVRLLQLAQKLLDRCIFTLFCDDMGKRVRFPPDLLKDFLKNAALDPISTESGNDIWLRLVKLFEAMNVGDMRFFRKEPIRRFNGGLFAPDDDLDGLHLPNSLFCRLGGGDIAEDHPDTLLYLALRYNFGVRNDGERSINLYTLGRIFEQSVRDIEEGLDGLRRSAEVRAKRRASAKRKREGVYYTPEWVVEKIVDETVGCWLSDRRQRLGCDGIAPEEEAARANWLKALDRYAADLDNLSILDPACGSGAFLIYATRYVLAERERVLRTLRRWNDAGMLASTDHVNVVLTRNIFGVDINPAAVEIARLAVWLETVNPDYPLAHLEANIIHGNSLVGTDIRLAPQAAKICPERWEEIAPMDWSYKFPAVMERGGFDCIVGNPPYVKLQNYKPNHPETVDYMQGWGKKENAPYESTRTGNMDIYLPFIEKGLSLLSDDGRMGLIAPNVWLVSEYGEGLRRLVKRQRSMDRWVDFKDFQVFEEVTVYTALQFFTKRPVDALRFVHAPDGAVAALDWNDADRAIPYEELADDEAWPLATGPERRLIRRLTESCWMIRR